MTEQNVLASGRAGQLVKVRPEAAIELVTFGKVDTNRLISQIFPLEESRRSDRQLEPRRRDEGVDKAHPGTSNVIK